MNSRTVLLSLFVVLTIAFASTTVYEAGMRTTLTSTSTSTVTATKVSTTTATSTVDIAKALRDAYLSHIGAIETENVTALEAQYEANATLHAVVIGYSPKDSEGIANITGFYQAAPTNICDLCHALKAPFSVANETHSITISSDLKTGNVTSRLVFYGNDSVSVAGGGCYVPNVGPCEALAYVAEFDISYVLQGNHWLISTESVTYVNLLQCLTTSLSSDGSVLTCQVAS